MNMFTLVFLTIACLFLEKNDKKIKFSLPLEFRNLGGFIF